MLLTGKRYQNDGIPIMTLNSIQLQAKKDIEEKISSGSYKFENTKCPVCDSAESLEVSNKDRYGLHFPVVMCNECGLIRTNPRMDQESYNRFYKEDYRRLYNATSGPNKEFLCKQYGQGRRIYKYLEKNIAKSILSKDARILEIGCGSGGIIKYFYDNGCSVKGLDLGDEYINFGREEYGIDIAVGTLSDIDSYDPDVIIYSHVLEHILDIEGELKKLYSLMNEQTFLYIELPGLYNLRGSYRNDFLLMMQNAHVYHFSLASLCNLMRKNGFRFVSGDEDIRAIFCKGDDSRIDVVSVFDNNTRYFSTLEFKRKYLRFTPSFIYVKTRKAFVSLLKKMRIYDMVKSIVQRK